MRTDRQRSGDEAERRVESYLVARGWRTIGRGVRVGRTELDIVALDPGPPRCLVVVEVRFRSRRDFGLPEETVDAGKRRRLRTAALALVSADATPEGVPLPRLPLRIDLVAVEPGSVIRHHRGVF